MLWLALLALWLPQPPSADSWLQLVEQKIAQGDPAGALQAAQDGLAVHPQSVPLLKAAGRLLLRDQRRSALARDPLTRAVQLAPQDPETHYYFSQWACLHNMDALCETEARKALEMAPGNEQASLQLNTLIGMAAERQNRPEAAEQAHRRSLESNRKTGLRDPLAAYQYLDFLLKRGRDEDAQTLVALLIDRAPSFGPAWLERAKYLARQGKTTAAIDLAEKALTLEAMDAEKLRAAHVLLARAYFQLGREEEAARHQAWVEQNRD
jgi:tetratricopeptide (TPR) repeat protein